LLSQLLLGALQQLKRTDICFENKDAHAGETFDSRCQAGNSFSVLGIVSLDLIDNEEGIRKLRIPVLAVRAKEKQSAIRG
jgi:hypothetical protein